MTTRGNGLFPLPNSYSDSDSDSNSKLYGYIVISESEKLHICDSWGKLETSNLTFFHTIDIYEMVAIFQYFHNGQWSYAISIDTRKTGDPKFGARESAIRIFSV